jgi:F-type H+-transporting ATPase subunit a
MLLSPFTQFEINLLKKIQFLVDLSITNFTIYLLVVSFVLCFFFYNGTQRLTLIPNNFQIIFENLYTFILNILLEQTGVKGQRFFPLLFVIFSFIFTSNIIGLFPFSFTITAHIALTFLLALSFFSAWIIQGFITLKWSFFNIFLPKGIPGWLMPLLMLLKYYHS